MRKYLSGKIFPAGILAALLLMTDLTAQTAIVNAQPLSPAAEAAADYTKDVETGLLEYLFDLGYIIFNQSTADSAPVLVELGKETGADIVIDWSQNSEGLDGSLIDCRTGQTIRAVTIDQKVFEDIYKNNDHEMYSAMGYRLCEEMIPDEWN